MARPRTTGVHRSPEGDPAARTNPPVTPPRRRIALALAGGNALGAYIAGAYEALHARGYRPDIISGASIGAVTGGIIAGNPLDTRIPKLREFWDQAAAGTQPFAPPAGGMRELYNRAHVMQAAMFGRPGLFAPRIPGLLSALPGIPADVAFFDHGATAATLERVIDFDLLNRADIRLIVSAADMQTGEPVRFDTRATRLAPAHFLASSAFVPSFPPVEIDGRWLGDYGLIGNLPLGPLLEAPLQHDLLCFAIDLFAPNDETPRQLGPVLERVQDILFAAQSKRSLEAGAQEHRLRHMIGEMLRTMGEQAESGKPLAHLAREGTTAELTLVSLAYKAPAHELAAKTFDYSRASVEECWVIGTRDMHLALDRLEAGESTSRDHGCTVYYTRAARA